MLERLSPERAREALGGSMSSVVWSVVSMVAFGAVVALAIGAVITPRIHRWWVNAALGVAFVPFALSQSGGLRWALLATGLANVAASPYLRARELRSAAVGPQSPLP